MEEVYFVGFGIRIVKSDNQLFLRFDAGEMFVGDDQDVVISREEAEVATRSKQEAHALLQVCRRRLAEQRARGERP